jgi:predicted NBD/HSP70 family sugar kinase
MNTVTIGGTANANVQNQINISIVFNYLKSHGATYRAEIARNLGLSAPAVSRAVEHLMAQGYVIESGTGTTESGKKVTEISINGRKGSVIAVDLLKGESKFGMYDLSGELVYGRKGPRLGEVENVETALISQLEMVFSEAEKHCEVAENGASPPPVKAICLGIPAAVDAETGRVTGAPLYEDLTQINFKEVVEKRFDVTCFVENDVKLAAFAENRLGQGKLYRNLVYIDINDGIGAGIILDHRIVRGGDGLAGEIGYFLTSPEDLDHSAVTRGNLEERASVEALGRVAADAMSRGVTTSIVPGETGQVRPYQVYQAALEGDSFARRLVDQSVNYIAMAAVNLTLILNPETIVVGGDIYDMPGVQELFLSPLARRLQRALPFASPRVEFSSLGSEACLLGASMFAGESLLSGKYPFAVDYSEFVQRHTAGAAPSEQA